MFDLGGLQILRPWSRATLLLFCMKIGILVPTSSKDRSWEKPEYSYLYKFFQSCKKTFCKEHTYVFYIAYDFDDPFYLKHAEFFTNLGLDIRFTVSKEEKGWVTRLWNILASQAFHDGCDYLFQCGDDIFFHQKGWVSASIEALQHANNLGVTGPKTEENAVILTQAFVHRTHIEIFGFFFPEEIKNWWCDDWINAIYPKNWLKAKYTCGNLGGKERYTIARDGKYFLPECVKRDMQRVAEYKQKKLKTLVG